MDSFILGEDIEIVCLRAKSFPDDVQNAQGKLHELLPVKEGRRFFGISWPDIDGEIIYNAAAEEMELSEAESLRLDRFTIKRGAYNSYYIIDYRHHPDAIRRSFELLTAQAEANPNGYCVEWYIGDNDVKCMVRSADEDYP